MPRVLVTDASERAALAIIRSLGQKRIEVVAADSRSFNPGFLSKYCSHRIIYPPPEVNKSKFIDFMLRILRTERFDLLIPVTDFTMIPMLEHRDDFEKQVKVALPPYEVAIKALDKAQTLKIAKECGVPYPETFIVKDADILKETARHLRYPVVIKPRMKVIWHGQKALMLKVTQRNYAYNYEDLVQKFSKITTQLKGLDIPQDFFMVQEFVGGVSYGVEVLMYNSELKAVFMHKRLREYPITGGASTLRISVRNERLKNYAVNLLRAMGWQGVAMVEFKVEEKNYEAKLIEVNGRFWGSLPLAISAEVDFPYLLYKSIVDGDVATCYDYIVGVMQRWLIPGDLLWLFAALQDRQRSRAGTLREFMSSLLIRDDIISLNDISPTAGTVIETLRYFFDVIRGKRTIYGEILEPS